MTKTDSRIAPLLGWIVHEGLEGGSRKEMLAGFCQKLVEAGVPLKRFHLAQRAFHPQFGGIGFHWTRDEGISKEFYENSDGPREEWMRSPLFYLLETGVDELRSDLKGQDIQRFPFFGDLKAAGATDYFAAAIRFEPDRGEPFDPMDPGEGMLASWTTDRPRGFDDSDIDLVRAVLPYVGLALKAASNRKMASDLLQVYLGRDAGRRVLSGEIQRGSSRKIDAVICLFDLEGFTSLAEQLPGTEVIEMLNDYFGITVAEIQAHGGNILKFLGDGILAMFDLGSIKQDAEAALEMSVSLTAKLQQRSAERAASGLPAPDFTLALHAGEILYGNIGAENRLDFTAIGPSVNLTARLSGMHRSVGRRIIMSEVVQRAAQDTSHDLVSLGRYMLRGVSEPVELYTLYSGEEVQGPQG